jgi:hypothetical protein
MDGMRGAGLPGNGELCVVDIDSDGVGSAKGRGSDGSEAHSPASDDSHRVLLCYRCAGYGVCTDGQWLNQAEFFQVELSYV